MLNKPEDILEQKKSETSILNLRIDKIITLEPKENITEQTLNSMENEFEIFKIWAKNEKLGFLVDSRRIKKFDSELRVFVQKNVSHFANKYAIIISSGISSFLANIFIHINRPNIPTKIFTTKEDAIRWLKSLEK